MKEPKNPNAQHLARLSHKSRLKKLGRQGFSKEMKRVSKLGVAARKKSNVKRTIRISKEIPSRG